MNNEITIEKFNSKLCERLEKIIPGEFSSIVDELKHVVESLKKHDAKPTEQAELFQGYIDFFENNKSIDLKDKDCVFKTIMILGALSSEIELFINASKGVQSPFAWSHMWKGLLKKIKSVSTHLWQLVSSLLKLKEWSVSGNAGINVFGLSGGVTLQLTFEK